MSTDARRPRHCRIAPRKQASADARSVLSRLVRSDSGEDARERSCFAVESGSLRTVFMEIWGDHRHRGARRWHSAASFKSAAKRCTKSAKGGARGSRRVRPTGSLRSRLYKLRRLRRL
jgi:hypothetical protein